jgi:hypothetical protein
MPIDRNEKVKCYNCHEVIDHSPGDKIYRDEDCEHCGVSLKVCKMCRFYTPEVYNECSESSAQKVPEKEKSNYCDYFFLTGTNVEKENKNKLLNEADALFKK